MIAMETVSIFLIAAGVLLIVIAIVSFFFSARKNPKLVIDVSLPELASVWLKYNDEVTAINDIPEGVESLAVFLSVYFVVHFVLCLLIILRLLWKKYGF